VAVTMKSLKSGVVTMNKNVTKEEFCFLMEQLEKAERCLGQIEEGLGINGEWRGWNLIDVLHTVVDSILQPADHEQHLLCKFYYTLDFGRCYEDGDVISKNGEFIPIWNAEDMWDYLHSEEV